MFFVSSELFVVTKYCCEVIFLQIRKENRIEKPTIDPKGLEALMIGFHYISGWL